MAAKRAAQIPDAVKARMRFSLTWWAAVSVTFSRSDHFARSVNDRKCEPNDRAFAFPLQRPGRRLPSLRIAAVQNARVERLIGN